MIETKTKEIDGTLYKVQQMDGVRGIKAQTKLIKILGPSVGKTLLSGAKLENAKDVIGAHLMENFDDSEVSDFVISLFDKGVFFENDQGEDQMVVFSKHFTGEPLRIWKVAFFILNVNFGEIMGKLTGGLNLLQKGQSKSQKGK